MTSLYEQIVIIVYYIILGMFFGVSFDTLNCLLKKTPLIIKYIIEIIYWFLFIILISYFIINKVYGYIRLYTIIFFILGFTIHLLLLSKKYKKNISFILTKLNVVFKKILPFIINIILPKELFHFLIKKLKFKKRGKKDEEIINEADSFDASYSSVNCDD